MYIYIYIYIYIYMLDILGYNSLYPRASLTFNVDSNYIMK